MHATVNLINERLKNAPQEVLDRLLGYLDAITSENDNSIPKEHKNLVLDRMKNSKEEDLLNWEDIKDDFNGI
jgi:hypothetical protein